VILHTAQALVQWQGYELDNWGSIPSRGQNFAPCHCTRPALRPTQPPIQ